jgi:hypothetical protein
MALDNFGRDAGNIDVKSMMSSLNSQVTEVESDDKSIIGFKSKPKESDNKDDGISEDKFSKLIDAVREIASKIDSSFDEEKEKSKSWAESVLGMFNKLFVPKEENKDKRSAELRSIRKSVNQIVRMGASPNTFWVGVGHFSPRAISDIRKALADCGLCGSTSRITEAIAETSKGTQNAVSDVKDAIRNDQDDGGNVINNATEEFNHKHNHGWKFVGSMIKEYALLFAKTTSEAFELNLTDITKGIMVDANRHRENMRSISYTNQGFVKDNEDLLTGAKDRSWLGFIAGYEKKDIEKDRDKSQMTDLMMTAEMTKSSGVKSSIIEGMMQKNLQRGHVIRLKDEKTEKSLLNLSDKRNRNLKAMTTTAASTAYALNMGAEETNDVFMDWQMHLGMSSNQMSNIGRSMRQIAMSTGVTGKNLEGVLKSSDGIMKSMRNSGLASSTMAKKVLEISANAKRFGIEEDINAQLQALSGSGNFAKADEDTQRFLTRGRIGRGGPHTHGNPMEMFFAQDSGSFLKKPKMIKDFINNTDDAVRQLLEQGFRSHGINVDPKTIDLEKIPEFLESLGPGQNQDALRRWVQQQFKFQMGTDLGKYSGLRQSYMDLSKTEGEKQKSLQDRIAGTKEGTDIRRDLQKQLDESKSANIQEILNEVTHKTSKGTNIEQAIKEVRASHAEQFGDDLITELLGSGQGDKDSFKKSVGTLLDNLDKTTKDAKIKNATGGYEDLNSILQRKAGMSRKDIEEKLASGDAEQMDQAQTALNYASDELKTALKASSDPITELRYSVDSLNATLQDVMKGTLFSKDAALPTYIASTTASTFGQLFFAAIGGMFSGMALQKGFGIVKNKLFGPHPNGPNTPNPHPNGPDAPHPTTHTPDAPHPHPNGPNTPHPTTHTPDAPHPHPNGPNTPHPTPHVPHQTPHVKTPKVKGALKYVIPLIFGTWAGWNIKDKITGGGNAQKPEGTPEGTPSISTETLKTPDVTKDILNVRVMNFGDLCECICECIGGTEGAERAKKFNERNASKLVAPAPATSQINNQIAAPAQHMAQSESDKTAEMLYRTSDAVQTVDDVVTLGELSYFGLPALGGLIKSASDKVGLTKTLAPATNYISKTAAPAMELGSKIAAPVLTKLAQLAPVAKFGMKALGPAAVALEAGIGGYTGAHQAKEEGLSTTTGTVLGALTGSAKSGTSEGSFSGIVSDKLGLQRGGNADEMVGAYGVMAGGAMNGALIGATVGGPAGAAVGAAAGAAIASTAEVGKVLQQGQRAADEIAKSSESTTASYAERQTKLLEQQKITSPGEDKSAKLQKLQADLAKYKERQAGQEKNLAQSKKEYDSRWSMFGFNPSSNAAKADKQYDEKILAETKRTVSGTMGSIATLEAEIKKEAEQKQKLEALKPPKPPEPPKIEAPKPPEPPKIEAPKPPEPPKSPKLSAPPVVEDPAAKQLQSLKDSLSVSKARERGQQKNLEESTKEYNNSRWGWQNIIDPTRPMKLNNERLNDQKVLEQIRLQIDSLNKAIKATEDSIKTKAKAKANGDKTVSQTEQTPIEMLQFVQTQFKQNGISLAESIAAAQSNRPVRPEEYSSAMNLGLFDYENIGNAIDGGISSILFENQSGSSEICDIGERMIDSLDAIAENTKLLAAGTKLERFLIDHTISSISGQLESSLFDKTSTNIEKTIADAGTGMYYADTTRNLNTNFETPIIIQSLLGGGSLERAFDRKSDAERANKNTADAGTGMYYSDVTRSLTSLQIHSLLESAYDRKSNAEKSDKNIADAGKAMYYSDDIKKEYVRDIQTMLQSASVDQLQQIVSKVGETSTNLLDYSENTRSPMVSPLMSGMMDAESRVAQERYGSMPSRTTIPGMDGVEDYLAEEQNMMKLMIQYLSEIANNTTRQKTNQVIGSTMNGLPSSGGMKMRRMSQDFLNGEWDLTFGDYSPSSITT